MIKRQASPGGRGRGRGGSFSCMGDGVGWCYYTELHIKRSGLEPW